MTIELSTTDKRDGKALALFAAWESWQTGHTKDGRPFFAIPGSEDGLLHMADQNDCSCPDRKRARNVCKHMRAVRFWFAAFKTGAVAPKPRPATPSVEDDAGIGDVLVALTPAGAAHLAASFDPMAEPRPSIYDSDALVFGANPRPSYADLFPSCKGGCGDVSENRDGYCGRCASDREWQARREAFEAIVPFSLNELVDA